MTGQALNFMAGLLVIISVGLATWSLVTVVGHEGRLAAIETCIQMLPTSNDPPAWFLQRFDRMEQTLTARIDRLEAKIEER